MPRTVDLEKHTVRREAFLDVAQQLITTKGYEQMSIQDVLDALETSRGAFYHYFDSKQNLLDGVVERFTNAAMDAVAPILADPRVPALRKLEQVWGAIARFKAEQKDLVLALIKVWNSDGNSLLRDKVRVLTVSRFVPLLAAIIRQGTNEGSFTATSPDETAQVIVYLIQGFQQLGVEQFLACRAGTLAFEDVQRTYAGFTEALERILGIASGSARLVDEATLRFWFD